MKYRFLLLLILLIMPFSHAQEVDLYYSEELIIGKTYMWDYDNYQYGIEGIENDTKTITFLRDMEVDRQSLIEEDIVEYINYTGITINELDLYVKPVRYYIDGRENNYFDVNNYEIEGEYALKAYNFSFSNSPDTYFRYDYSTGILLELLHETRDNGTLINQLKIRCLTDPNVSIGTIDLSNFDYQFFIPLFLLFMILVLMWMVKKKKDKSSELS